MQTRVHEPLVYIRLTGMSDPCLCQVIAPLIATTRILSARELSLEGSACILHLSTSYIRTLYLEL
jgi:hypothetical protein